LKDIIEEEIKKAIQSKDCSSRRSITDAFDWSVNEIEVYIYQPKPLQALHPYGVEAFPNRLPFRSFACLILTTLLIGYVFRLCSNTYNLSNTSIPEWFRWSYSTTTGDDMT
jgi:hypothetical protein